VRRLTHSPVWPAKKSDFLNGLSLAIPSDSSRRINDHPKEERMKLRMLAVAAGLVVLPAIAVAQTPTDTTARDTTARDTTMKATTTAAPAVTTAAKDSTLEPKPVPPSDGTTCPWGCPTSSGAAGLTGPQFLALQQELRDSKCGNNRVTGRLDAATRTGIRNCARKLGVANNAAAVLVALNIGYGPGDVNMPSGQEE
jgi:hypothetical protein